MNGATTIQGAATPISQLPPSVEIRPFVEPARLTLVGVEWESAAIDHDWLADLPLSALAARQPDPPGWSLIKRGDGRTIWAGESGDRRLIVKIQEYRGWRDQIQAWRGKARGHLEWQAGLYAAQHGVAVARPLAFAPRGSASTSVTVFERLDNATPLNEFWLQTLAALSNDAPGIFRTVRNESRLAAATRLADAIARLVALAHQCGLEHVDLHPGNIMIQSPPREFQARATRGEAAPRRDSSGVDHPCRAVLIDLAGARFRAPVNDERVVRNLAQLNQWFRRHATLPERMRFLRHYLRWRDEFEAETPFGRRLELEFPELVRRLDAAAEDHARRLWARRDRRALRGGKYFHALRLPGGWRGFAAAETRRRWSWAPSSQQRLSRDWWQGRLRDPATLWTPPRADVCKDSHSALVTRVSLAEGDVALEVIVKRPLGRNASRRLRNLLSPSRSLRAWMRGNALLHREIPTARPLAVLERRLGPLVLDSVLLTEVAPGAMDLEVHLREEFARRAPRAWLRHKRLLATLLGRQLRALRAADCAHDDCKAQNLLVRVGERVELVWIDMDGVRPLMRAVTREEAAASLARLHVSLLPVPGLTRGDRARMLRVYAAGYGSRPDAWRDWWRAAAPRVEAKLAARQAREEWKLRAYGRK